jgi:hypothetical protein
MVIIKKYKRVIIKLLAVLNSVEGIVHIIVATIGTWGCLDLGIYDFRVLLPNIENYLFGIFSLLTGIIIVKLK